MDNTTAFLNWFSRYAEGAKIVFITKAALTPQLRSIFDMNDEDMYGKFHGVQIQVTPSWGVKE